MDDREILQRMDTLIKEEHRLTGEHHGGRLSEAERQRMDALEVMLDQCWDLLRQRRTRRHAGQNPDETEVRPASVVERFVG